MRPDGKETYVQSGYLKSEPAQAGCEASSLLEPVLQACGARTYAKVPKGKLTKLIIPLYYEGHVYRAGSRIRVTGERAGRRPTDLGLRRGGPDA